MRRRRVILVYLLAGITLLVIPLAYVWRVRVGQFNSEASGVTWKALPATGHRIRISDARVCAPDRFSGAARRLKSAPGRAWRRLRGHDADTWATTTEEGWVIELRYEWLAPRGPTEEFIASCSTPGRAAAAVPEGCEWPVGRFCLPDRDGRVRLFVASHVFGGDPNAELVMEIVSQPTLTSFSSLTASYWHPTSNAIEITGLGHVKPRAVRSFRVPSGPP